MTVQGYQRFRYKEQVLNVPILLLDDEQIVFLNDIQLIFRCKVESFTVNNNPVVFTRDHGGHRKEPLRIQANINEIIDVGEVQESVVDQSLHDKMNHVCKKADKILENTEELKTKVNAILTQTYELAEFTVPRLFIILPDEISRFNPTNLFQHSFRLFFLCECEGQPHLALHEGYEINQPREFIQKYGLYLTHMITVVKCAMTVGSILVPVLGSIGQQIPVPSILNNPNFFTSFHEKLNKMESALAEINDGNISTFSSDINLEGADLREIESFLKKKDESRRLGNLNRTTTSTGNVRWVCIHHYRKFYADKKCKELQKQLRSLGGIIHDDEIIIDKNGAKNFESILNIISDGLCRFKLTLRNCKIEKSEFKRMLTIISQRPDIKCLELFSIKVLHFGALNLTTPRQIVDKLNQTLGDRKDLTIKYAVKYPRDNSALDPDLFDYAQKYSTERLILQIYTRSDGKKIVLKDLSQPILYRMATSLNQSQIISHCAINEFNRELSGILLNNTTITKLTIFLVEFDEQKITALRQFLTKRKYLRELRLSTCKNLSPLITMLCQELVKNVKLELLAINGISENQQFIELSTMLEKNNHLIELNLGSNIYIDFPAMIQISDALKTNKCLRKLKLTGVRGVVHENPSLSIFEYFFRNTSIEQLTLCFDDHQTNINLCETIAVTENVKILELSQCNLLSNKMFHNNNPIIISNNLTSLCLHSCQLLLQEAVDLFQGLSQNKTLTELSLTKIYIPDDTHGQRFFKGLSDMLLGNTGLKKLTYSHGNLRDEGIMIMHEALLGNKTLEELNISFNQISDIGAVSLAITLANNNVLLLLDIHGNHILCEGIYNILKSLQNNWVLKQLHISEPSYKNNLDEFNRAKEKLFDVNGIINIYWYDIQENIVPNSFFHKI